MNTIRGAAGLVTLRQEVCQSGRALFRVPRFTAPLIVTLALGIGGTATVFTVVRGVLLRPLPYPEPDRLIYIREHVASIGSVPFARPPEYLAWIERAESLAGIGAYLEAHANLATEDGAERVICGSATASFFHLLGAQPTLGRLFWPGEDRRGAQPVAILSEALWRRRFGGDPSVVGRVIILDAAPYTVVGVLPGSFVVPDRYATTYDVWIPFTLTPIGRGNPPVLRVVGRMKPGLHLDEVRSELDAILKAVTTQGTARSVLVSPWHEEIVGAVRTPLRILFAAVVILLLIACVNAANLTLTRAVTREREIAMRIALGATRGRIVRQILIETVVVTFVGGTAALAVGYWSAPGFVRLLSQTLPALPPIRFDATAIAFTVGLTLVVGLALVSVSAWTVPVTPQAALQGSAPSIGGGPRSTFRTLMVVLQVSVATVVLIAAALLFKTVLRMRTVDVGFREDNILSVMLSLTPRQYPKGADQARFFREVISGIERLPGVESAGASSAVPLTGAGGAADISIEQEPDTFRVAWSSVSENYFRVMGIVLRQGRYLTDRDDYGAPGVALVNQLFVRRHCPETTCLGKRIRLAGRGGSVLTVVGVVSDVRSSVEHAPDAEIYTSYLQQPVPSMTLVLDARGDAMLLAPAVRAEIGRIRKDQPPYDVATVKERRVRSTAARRMHMLLLLISSGLALILAGVGIYGLLSYSVAQRTREIGLRIALGASPRDVRWSILWSGVPVVGTGAAVGLAAAAAANKTLSPMVFGISTTDPLTYAQITVAWTAIALAAGYGPARRASKLEPVSALRHE